MHRRRGLDIHLVLSIPTRQPQDLARVFSRCMESIGRRDELERLPLHWHFPAAALPSDGPLYQQFVPYMRGRIASQSDALLPMGFCGAYHALLLPEDLKCELEWASRNPWGCGVNDIFGDAQTFLMPPQADLLRNSALSLYKETPGAKLLPVILETPGRRRRSRAVLLCRSGNPAAYIRLEEVPCDHPEVLRRILPALR